MSRKPPKTSEEALVKLLRLHSEALGMLCDTRADLMSLELRDAFEAYVAAAEKEELDEQQAP